MYDYYSYGRAFRENKCWSEPDFTKPGLEFEEGLKHRDYKFGVREMEVKENQVKIHLAGDEQAAEEFSCPREAVLYLYIWRKGEMQCKLAGKRPGKKSRRLCGWK